MASTTEQRILERIKDRANLGACGSIYIDDTTTEHSGPFSAVTALVNSTIDVSECTTNIKDADQDILIPAGVTIFGDFTSLQFDTAAGVIAYYRCD